MCTLIWERVLKLKTLDARPRMAGINPEKNLGSNGFATSSESLQLRALGNADAGVG